MSDTLPNNADMAYSLRVKTFQLLESEENRRFSAKGINSLLIYPSELKSVSVQVNCL